MISFPRTPDEAVAADGEYRAGGTDVQERYGSGVSSGAIVDLRNLSGFDRIEWLTSGAVRIGALTPVATIAADERLRRSHPAVAMAAEQIATPQIRSVATLGGNLLQRTRCWYFRHPAASCLKKGGDSCPARGGNHLYSVCFDLGPCVAPHPSTLAVALLAHGATAELHGHPSRPLDALFGDGSDPGYEHRATHGELLTWVSVPAPVTAASARYVRVAGRRHGEWPLVEVAACLAISEDGIITAAAVAAGGVAPVPLRLRSVEEALLGRPRGPETLGRAAAAARIGATPLPQTHYKLRLLEGAVLEALEQAIGDSPQRRQR